MADNRRISRSRSNTAKDLARAEKAAPTPRNAQARARELASEVHRLEVEIVATTRLAREHRVRNADTLPALDRRSSSARGIAALTLAQKRSRRHRFYLQTAQFAITSCLLAGAAAWLFKLWQSLQ